MGAEVALLRELGRVVSAGVENLDWAAAGHAAGVDDRRAARRTPRVELENIFLGPGGGALVRGPVLGVVERRCDRFSRAVVEVRQPAPVVVACPASDRTTLAEPEARLPVVAPRGAVGAVAGVGLDLPGRWVLSVVPAGGLGVHGVPGRRHDHGAVRARERKKRDGSSHHRKAASEPELLSLA